MQQSGELDRVTTAFLETARTTDPAAPIASRIWPTAGEIVDHLGTIQRWATAVLRTGAAADETDHEHPADRETLDWFAEGAAALVAEVEKARPDEDCWTFVGPGRKAFWGRRMVHEATKHLWDLRTAADTAPPMPPEIDPGTAAAIIDEFDEVFIARARRQGIAPLPGAVLLRSLDEPRGWLLHPDWRVDRDPDARAVAAVAPATLTASTADLALLLWERADPWRLPDRFARSGDEDAIRAVRDTPVHL